MNERGAGIQSMLELPKLRASYRTLGNSGSWLAAGDEPQWEPLGSQMLAHDSHRDIFFLEGWLTSTPRTFCHQKPDFILFLALPPQGLLHSHTVGLLKSTPGRSTVLT